MKRRDDKSWEQASTSEQFADMYRRQIREAPARAAVGSGGGAEIVRRGSEEVDGGEEGGEEEVGEGDEDEFEEEET